MVGSFPRLSGWDRLFELQCGKLACCDSCSEGTGTLDGGVAKCAATDPGGTSLAGGSRPAIRAFAFRRGCNERDMRDMVALAPTRRVKVACAFGTRPEIIKLFPLLRELERRAAQFELLTISTAQHVELLHPLLALFRIEPTVTLNVMQPGQGLNPLLARIIERIDPVLETMKSDIVLVQGDTATALGVALACWNRAIPVGHVEAGLRTESADNPFPEEMYRRLIGRIATLHFAATSMNVRNLIAEGVNRDRIIHSGNTIVDALRHMLSVGAPTPELDRLLQRVGENRIIVLTTHRRETSDHELIENLTVLRNFLDSNSGYALIFPVHLNPRVRAAAAAVLADMPRAWLIEPLNYGDFIQLLSRAWLIVSDSGGIQEEAPSLGKRVLVLRRNTERPEAVTCGAARLMAGRPDRLAAEMKALATDDRWLRSASDTENPFGTGDSAVRIADAIADYFSNCQDASRHAS
jgi:UDP-N-acetylglucosamine 2-epimerase (non-hydrolysing)